MRVVAKQRVAPADPVQRTGLPGPVARRAAQVEGLLGVPERVRRAALHLGQFGQAIAGARLAGRVAELREHVQGALEVRACLIEAPPPGIAKGEAMQGVGLPDLVAEAARGGQGGVMSRDLLGPEPLPEQERPEDPRQLPGLRVEAGRGGLRDGGEQHRTLGGEPGQRAVVARDVLRDDAGLRRRQGDRLPVHVLVHQQDGGVRGVQVVVEYPVHRRAPRVVAVPGPGLLGGVGAQQVVEGIPAGDVLGQQVRAG